MTLVTAEVRKLRTVRTTFVMTAVGWLLVALSTGVFLFTDQFGGLFTGTSPQIAAAIDQIGGNGLIVLIVAILAVTTEFRHGTIGRTLQLTPSRTRVLAAKMVGAVLYALVFFVTSLLLVAAMVALAAAIENIGVDVGAEAVTALWQGVVGVALYAIFGVAIGALFRSQVVTITVTLVWMLVAEQLVNALLPDVARWLPFQALGALFMSEETRAAVPEGMLVPLDPLVALAVFLTYVAVAVVAAGYLLRTRDV